jgi:ABC-type nitrate/sulfonate/bicarbonate transport system substrate-binding protein
VAFYRRALATCRIDVFRLDACDRGGERNTRGASAPIADRVLANLGHHGVALDGKGDRRFRQRGIRCRGYFHVVGFSPTGADRQRGRCDPNLSGAINASLRGFDVVFVAGLLNTMIWDLYARPEIKSAEQLKGKIVGTERPGSPVAYGTLVALRKLGLTPKDVQLRPLGGTVQTAAALQAGQISAGAAAPPVSFQLERAGFHSMTTTLDQPYQNVGLVVRRGRMDELAGRLVPLLRSVRAGIDRYYSDKAFTMKVIAKYTRETDPDLIERTYEFYRKAGFRRELMISEPGVQGILDFLSETIPEAKKAVPAQFFDDRFVRQLNSGR